MDWKVHHESPVSSLLVLFVLKASCYCYTTLALFWLVFARGFCSSFLFQFLCLRCASCKPHIVGFCFVVQFDNLCALTGTFSLLTINVIIKIYLGLSFHTSYFSSLFNVSSWLFFIIPVFLSPGFESKMLFLFVFTWRITTHKLSLSKYTWSLTWCFNLWFFFFWTMMGWKRYTSSRNYTSNFEVWSFPGLVICGKTLSHELGSSSELQLPVSLTVTRVKSVLCCQHFLDTIFNKLCEIFNTLL